MARVKIDISNGTLEVEGEEKFVERIYADFKGKLAGVLGEIKGTGVKTLGTPKPAKKTEKKARPKKGSKKRKESYNIVKDLDLSGKGAKISLKDFYKEKSPSYNMERNAVIVYYLQRELNTTGITVDHVYTCYRNVGAKVPRALKQSLLDTSSDKGWIDTKNTNDITITTQGENLIKELPRAKEKTT